MRSSLNQDFRAVPQGTAFLLYSKHICRRVQYVTVPRYRFVTLKREHRSYEKTRHLIRVRFPS